MEEKIKTLKDIGVLIDTKIDDSEWIVCHEDISDAGSIGCYSVESFFDTFEEAIEFAYNCELENISVEWVSQNPF